MQKANDCQLCPRNDGVSLLKGSPPFPFPVPASIPGTALNIYLMDIEWKSQTRCAFVHMRDGELQMMFLVSQSGEIKLIHESHCTYIYAYIKITRIHTLQYIIEDVERPEVTWWPVKLCGRWTFPGYVREYRLADTVIILLQAQTATPISRSRSLACLSVCITITDSRWLRNGWL